MAQPKRVQVLKFCLVLLFISMLTLTWEHGFKLLTISTILFTLVAFWNLYCLTNPREIVKTVEQRYNKASNLFDKVAYISVIPLIGIGVTTMFTLTGLMIYEAFLAR